MLTLLFLVGCGESPSTESAPVPLSCGDWCRETLACNEWGKSTTRDTCEGKCAQDARSADEWVACIDEFYESWEIDEYGWTWEACSAFGSECNIYPRSG